MPATVASSSVSDSGMERDQYVLIAEDNPALLRVTRFAVERAGYTVETAVDGAEAIEKLRANAYGLLITDQQMPKMTGIEVVRAARELTAHASTPVILLTAKALELSHEQVAAELDVQHVLGKPFSPVQVAALVEELLSAEPLVVT